jgi:4-carboxymuconolactone decarboxylase
VIDGNLEIIDIESSFAVAERTPCDGSRPAGLPRTRPIIRQPRRRHPSARSRDGVRSALNRKEADVSRIELLSPDRQTTEQRELYHAIRSGRRGQATAAPGRQSPGGGLTDERGALVGPFNAWLLAPQVGDRIQRLGEAIRFSSSLPQNVLEVAILVGAREWRAEFEWWAHVRLARRAGVAPEVIAAIEAGTEPAFTDDGEAIAHRFSGELLTRREVSDETYAAARERLGEGGVMELVALLGYYTLVAMTLNVFQVPLPAGQQPSFGPATRSDR